MPAGLVLITPEVDLTESGDTFQTLLGIDNVLTDSLMNANLLYAGDHDLATLICPHSSGTSAAPTDLPAERHPDLFLRTRSECTAGPERGVEAELHVGRPCRTAVSPATPEDLELAMEISRASSSPSALNACRCRAGHTTQEPPPVTIPTSVSDITAAWLSEALETEVSSSR